MRKKAIHLIFLMLVLVTAVLSIWGPEVLSRWKDRSLIGKIHRQEVELSTEGYRYKLSQTEKLYVLSQALRSQSLSERGQGAARQERNPYQEPAENYALIINHRGLEEEPEGDGISQEEVWDICNKELEALKAAGILPDSIQGVEPELYRAVLYSAIDVREPRNYVAVWKVSLADDIRGIRKENRLMDVYMDADDGKIYEFYARTQWEWEEIHPDTAARLWCSYLELPEPTVCENISLLSESTPFFKKYVVSKTPEEQTIMTVGFYEGIREFFIKISR